MQHFINHTQNSSELQNAFLFLTKEAELKPTNVKGTRKERMTLNYEEHEKEQFRSKKQFLPQKGTREDIGPGTSMFAKERNPLLISLLIL